MDCGFESRREHGCLSLVSVVRCQVDVSATGQAPVHRSPTECGGSECDREASKMRRLWPTKGCRTMGMERTHVHFITRFVNHTVGGAYCYIFTAGFKLVISEHLLCKRCTK